MEMVTIKVVNNITWFIDVGHNVGLRCRLKG